MFNFQDDPLCVERPVDDSGCCVLVLCADATDEDDSPCQDAECGPNAECKREVLRDTDNTICVCKEGYAGDPDSDEDGEIGPCRNAYLKSWWNRLDFFIVLAAILGLIFPSVGFLRGLRAVRPIRVAIRIPLIKVVVKALLHSAPNVLNAILFGLFIVILSNNVESIHL